MALRLNELKLDQEFEAKLLGDMDDVRERAILERQAVSQADLPSLSSQLQQELPEAKFRYGFGPAPVDDKFVFFFDIDNCLYKRSTKIHDLMQIYIHRFFKKTLKLTDEEAHVLHNKYYKEYGLAIEGLVRHHKIDALEYNKVVDDSLPLEKVLRPNPALREMLLRIKEKGVCGKLWLFTNAYKNHGMRVVRLLGLGDVFDGMTFCDYSEFPLTCKPMEAMFAKALKDAGCKDKQHAYFVDDSGLNVRAAKKLGWGKVIQFVERDEDLPDLIGEDDKEREGIYVIRNILDIEKVAAELF
ncbi:unnamed protein product [Kuraishia capsulata CBS 1993]|uniref:Pyrimidine 5'-nucleotidase n=1 Tax=Kuraishia capsulata CBS 1993 TaxID=1382522 RepID=W6MXQ6_9ASCO|nr:uncharacterized protein KUCA_T00005293001 [Kuraishia capsulata CBS 1993]CDK29305.1 unnamed protein product [Kuraishia capsulata CBS 1993]